MSRPAANPACDGTPSALSEREYTRRTTRIPTLATAEIAVATATVQAQYGTGPGSVERAPGGHARRGSAQCDGSASNAPAPVASETCIAPRPNVREAACAPSQHTALAATTTTI